MMEGVDAKFWLTIVLYAINTVILLYVWLSNRRAATAKNIDDLKRKQNKEQRENEKRLVVLEAHKENSLKHDDLDGIYDRLTGIDKGLANLEGRFKSVDSLTAAIQEIGLKGKNL